MIDGRTTVGTVTLIVKDLNRSLDFYKNIIGFTTIKVLGNEAKLFSGDGEELLHLKENTKAAPVRQGAHAGLYHFALLLPDRESLATVCKHLLINKIPLGAGDHIVSEALYLSDPDGHGIEIYRDRPRSEWEWDANGHVKMDTLQLDGDSLLKEAKEWHGLPAKTVMGHVHMHVGNLDEINAYYHTLLGFDIVSVFRGQALFMSAGKYHHHLAFNTWAGVGATPQEEPACRMESYTILLPTKTEWENVYERVKENGSLVEKTDTFFTAKDPAQMQIIFKVKE
ncbi:MAG: VOC family protein [Bacillaceae bacterium]